MYNVKGTHVARSTHIITHSFLKPPYKDVFWQNLQLFRLAFRLDQLHHLPYLFLVLSRLQDRFYLCRRGAIGAADKLRV